MNEKEVKPRTQELPRPTSVKCPYKDEYSTDVLVIGCGFAGLNAAVSAREAGSEVLVVDKGKPGYSGLSPWPSSFRWFDPDRGDVEEAYKTAMMKGGDYLSNMNWYDCWLKESKGIYKRLTDWEILAQYPKAAEAGDYYEQEDFVGYREMYDKFDRHKKWEKVLNQYDIPVLEHTMVADLLIEDGQVCGVVAMHVQSGEIIVIHAKAVVMATGGGSYKPAGYPTGTNTFDGEYMAFEYGLPIMGKEFEDFHTTSTQGPGNVFLDNHWQYLENIWLCGGDIVADDAVHYAATKGNAMVLERVRNAYYGMTASDGSEIQDVATATYTRRGGSQVYGTDPEEVRSGKMSTPVAASQLGGAATGMCCHLTSGVFCGLEETNGATEIPGLYVAGDGIHATSPSGAAYPCGVGFTSCFTSIDGTHAGNAAAAFAAGKTQLYPAAATIEEKKNEILAPMDVERGYDPNWARDVLQSIMAPYWVSTVKSESTLNAALNQVLYMKDHVVPKLMARTSHDLRLCMEMEHKVQSAELKLRASLARKESRGNTYREDYPYRDDKDFLCYLTQRKDKDGQISMEKIWIPDEWAGDRNQPYNERYVYYFPGEPEKMGFEAPKSKW